MAQSSPIRNEKVREARLVWNAMADKMTINEKLHELFKYRFVQDDGLSKRELALLLFPREIRSTKSGEGRPLDTAEKKISSYLAQFRGWLENEGLVLIAEKTKEGYWIYYNVEKRPTLNEYKKRAKRSAEGAIRNADRMETIFDQGKRKRRSLTEKQSEQIILTVRRRTKRYAGDFES